MTHKREIKIKKKKKKTKCACFEFEISLFEIKPIKEEERSKK